MTKMLLLALGLTFAGTTAHAQSMKSAKTAKAAGPQIEFIGGEIRFRHH